MKAQGKRHVIGMIECTTSLWFTMKNVTSDLRVDMIIFAKWRHDLFNRW